MMTRPFASSFSNRAASEGTSPLHGPHHVRKTWSRTVLTLRSSSVSGAVLYHLIALNSGTVLPGAAAFSPEPALSPDSGVRAASARIEPRVNFSMDSPSGMERANGRAPSADPVHRQPAASA